MWGEAMKYSVEILRGLPFHGEKYVNHRRQVQIPDRADTARVKIEYDNGESVIQEFGYIDIEEVYQIIASNNELNLNRTYIKDFDLSKVKGGNKRIHTMSAYYAFFDGNIDFSNAVFSDGDVNLSHIIFGDGNVCFYRADFGEGDVFFHKSSFGNGNVDFNSSNFGNGNVDFKFTKFGTGNIDFNSTSFGDGDVYFKGASLGDGDIFFRQMKFGNGHVDFSSAVFGKGNIYFNNTDFGDGNIEFFHTHFGNGYVDFDNSVFGKGKIDFSHVIFERGDVNFSNTYFKKGDVDFNNSLFGKGNINFKHITFEDGNVRFNKTVFGNGSLDFSGTVFKNGNVDFKNVVFGTGGINFSKVDFGMNKVDFSNISFGSGKVTFENCRAKHLIFDNCVFDDYCDMRLKWCEMLSLNNCTFKDVFDMLKDDKYEVNIESISLINAKNLGQLYLDWENNKVKNMIMNQKHYDDLAAPQNTSNKQKLEQFRLLKENFHNLGRYEDEDKAYVEFKRYERVEEFSCEGIDRGSSFTLKRLAYYRLRAFRGIENFLKYIVLDKIGGYGTCPRNIFLTMVTVIFVFTGIYSLFPNMLELPVKCNITGEIPRAFYLSVETFLTIGYGNISPANNAAIVLAAMEGFMGVFLTSYFTIAFVRKILR